MVDRLTRDVSRGQRTPDELQMNRGNVTKKRVTLPGASAYRRNGWLMTGCPVCRRDALQAWFQDHVGVESRDPCGGKLAGIPGIG